jgi:hypothetical protein
VSRPELIRSARWRDAARDLVWRADELELVASDPVEAGGVVAAMPRLTDAWWADLWSSLVALAAFETERVGMLSKTSSPSSADGSLVPHVQAIRTVHGLRPCGQGLAPACFPGRSG